MADEEARVPEDRTVDAPAPAGSDPATNVGDLERLVCLIVGGALAVRCLARRTWGSALAGFLGAGLIHRGLGGRSLLYQALGIDTSSRSAIPVGEALAELEVEKTIRVDRPPEELFRFWKKLENLPRFLSHLRSVRVDLSGLSHWAAEGPHGERVEWDARFIEEREDEFLSWESTDVSEVRCKGWVSFRRMTAAETEVKVNLRYRPLSHALREALGVILGLHPADQLEDDLLHWKKIMEAGELSRGIEG